MNDRRVESAFHSTGALALKTRREESAVAVLDEPAPRPVLERVNLEDMDRPRIPRYVTSMQQSLFAMRDAQKLVSIDGEPAPRAARKSQPRNHNPRKKAINASYLPQQGVLEFVPVTGPQPRRLPTSVEAKIFCDHEVASIAHRTFAGLYDLAIIGILAMTFLGLIYWGCDDLAAAISDPLCASLIGAATVLIGLIYHSLFLAVRGQTPGMNFAGLRLVDFDGRSTSEKQMHMRIIGAFVSVLPAGFGLLWALVDEESLTWQDHISHTFPTPITTE